MSGADFAPEDGPEDLAAEYVLGTLDAAEAEAALMRIGSDPAFAQSVARWERKLAPLAALATPVKPPAGLWPRIADSLGMAEAAAEPASAPPVPPEAANENRSNGWRFAALAALATAACLAAYIAVRPAPLPPAYAVLTPLGSATGYLVAITGADGRMTVRASFTAAESGHDLELWSLPARAARPAPLGVLPPAGLTLPAVAPGTKLLVSLEPKGGSPTGLPTGPVLYGGIFTQLN